MTSDDASRDPVGREILNLIRYSDARRSLRMLGSDESEYMAQLAETWAFVHRMAADPAFCRHVWQSIVRDADIAGQLQTLITVVVKEWKAGQAVPQAEVERDSLERGSELPSLEPRSVRRHLDRDYPHVVEREVDEEDRRRRRVKSIVPDAQVGAVPVPEGYSFLTQPSPDPHLMKLGYRMLHVAPEMIEWSNLVNRLWNSAAGRPATTQLPKDPAEDQFHEAVTFWISTREIPALWFLSQKREQRLLQLKRECPFEYTEKDFERLEVAFAEAGISSTDVGKHCLEGAWALAELGHKRAALVVALGGLRIGDPTVDAIGDLHQVASIALYDLRESPLEAIRHARLYAEHRARQGDGAGEIIGLVCEVSARYALMAPRAHGPARQVLNEIRDRLPKLSPSHRCWAAGQTSIALREVGRIREAAEFYDLAAEAADLLPAEEYLAASRSVLRYAAPW